MADEVCYCLEEDCPAVHGNLPMPPQEFAPGLCVDCGMSVPGGEIICDICKSSWQTFQNSGHLGRRGHDTVQPGTEEFQDQSYVQLLLSEETTDAQVRASQEGPEA